MLLSPQAPVLLLQGPTKYLVKVIASNRESACNVSTTAYISLSNAPRQSNVSFRVALPFGFISSFQTGFRAPPPSYVPSSWKPPQLDMLVAMLQEIALELLESPQIVLSSDTSVRSGAEASEMYAAE
jgi:hypothetical protein